MAEEDLGAGIESMLSMIEMQAAAKRAAKDWATRGTVALGGQSLGGAELEKMLVAYYELGFTNGASWSAAKCWEFVQQAFDRALKKVDGVKE